MRKAVRFDWLVPGQSGFLKSMTRIFEEGRLCDHGTLCRAFGLDVVRAKFEIPDAWRGTGSARGDGHRGSLMQHAMVLFHDGNDYAPIGTLTILREGEKIRDVDPMDPREHYNLSNRI